MRKVYFLPCVCLFFAEQAEFQDSFISTLATRKDLYVTSLPLEKKRSAREAIALHAINHVTKSVCFIQPLSWLLTSY